MDAADRPLFTMPEEPTDGEAQAFRVGALFALVGLAQRFELHAAVARDVVGRLVRQGAWHEVIAQAHMERGHDRAAETLERLVGTIEATSPESLIAQARRADLADAAAPQPGSREWDAEEEWLERTMEPAAGNGNDNDRSEG